MAAVRPRPGAAGGAISLGDLLRGAETAPALLLPRLEPHPAGLWLGVACFLLGLAAASWEGRAAQVLGWIALFGLLLSMLLHARWKRARAGWWVDFEQRKLTPRELPGEAVALEGAGWSVVCAPGERRTAVAIDLRHAERGRVARLYDSGPWIYGRRLEQLDALADVLARRLRVERGGPRL